jgi:hypothetical protein
VTDDQTIYLVTSGLCDRITEKLRSRYNSGISAVGVFVAYSDFTVGKVKKAFGLTTVEGDRFLPLDVQVFHNPPNDTLILY